MGEHSKISWTDHTFNIAWGCEEVSPACDHCYAKSFAKAMGHEVWNQNPRRVFGEKHWKEPLKWNDQARVLANRITPQLEAANLTGNTKTYVFCSSMCDIFEVHPTVQQELKKLPPLIQQTPYLTWLLLTKRALEIRKHPELFNLPNVMMGATLENQSYDWRPNEHVSWLSVEPMLGPLDISRMQTLRWVIVGGESGAKARKMEMQWALDLKKQCAELGIAFHFKQLGDVLAEELGVSKWTYQDGNDKEGKPRMKRDVSGKRREFWPLELQVQQFPREAARV